MYSPVRPQLVGRSIPEHVRLFGAHITQQLLRGGPHEGSRSGSKGTPACHKLAKAYVCYPGRTIGCQQDVWALQVKVDNAYAMQVRKASCNFLGQLSTPAQIPMTLTASDPGNCDESGRASISQHVRHRHMTEQALFKHNKEYHRTAW